MIDDIHGVSLKISTLPIQISDAFAETDYDYL